ncbi:hypothetical protein CORC01_05714 [Colletotrichum orchidophilum]|uniref:Uncharacterized protein n=1 Tax=Colletotrichum orchidophilum TaxID=1209926 RepID=A0A1G4BCA7_9PEZI|nr:uncharacterized protein CORC01_05714 [Colletotrichum orchidophilum]OHE99024.1 hypothetical protein CORC01_05714 [Colletotrichum orchidophilum]
MRDQEPSDSPGKKLAASREGSMDEIWASAAEHFEKICGESLKKGEVKSFEDVQRQIENSGKAAANTSQSPEDSWDTAKSVGLSSLKYLKMLVGAASQASSFIPIPAVASNITASALSFVFDIPQAIKGYNDAVDQVFSEVSSALSQFQIYQAMENVDRLLINQINLVLLRFVEVCAHVIKHRQGRRRDRVFQRVKSIFDSDTDLAGAMASFKGALQGQRDVEGTVTLAVVVETQKAAQETHKGVQSLTDDADRTKTLTKIRDNLGVQSTVRLDTNTTQTVTTISDKCFNGTGSWIWTHDAYVHWTASNEKDVLVVSGPESSGKTSVTALITKRLEEQKGRTYVAHYFFPPSTKKSESDKNPVQTALKYMAFQIARVDVTVQKALSKACDAGPAAFRRSSSTENLEKLWSDLKIGAPGSGATYYLVFDGLENLHQDQLKMLLEFVFGSRSREKPNRRVRILVSGTDEKLKTAYQPNFDAALKIHMEKENEQDMRIVILESLNKQGVLPNAGTNSEQRKAKEKILEKLPQNVNGRYSTFQPQLDGVIRLLSTRMATVQELDRMLDQSMSSFEAAINDLQRSLTADEISELNEMLKWALFSHEYLSLEKLESAMRLYSGIESLTSLEYVIKNKYSAVLMIEDGTVYPQDGVVDYLRTKRELSNRSSNLKDRPTISMTITINNVDQELCGHFLWDLADMAIRDKFKFDFNNNASSALHSSSQRVISVDEFEANQTILTRAFDYLKSEPKEQTKEIGEYLICWLPYHLSQLRQLEDEDKGALTSHEQAEIGNNLYTLFKDDAVLRRHRASFEELYWWSDEMMDVQKWLTDSAIVRRLDKSWRSKMERARYPTRGYLKELVNMVVRGFLRDRSWSVPSACRWLKEFMAADKDKVEKLPGVSKPGDGDVNPDDGSSPSSSSAGSSDEIDWDIASKWCQDVLGLSDAELDSLWYERLAEASSWVGNDPDQAISLYQRAIQLENPSWRCYHGLGVTYYNRDQSDRAIEQVELALKEAESEKTMPKPGPQEIVELHLLLGKYNYEAGNMPTAAQHYSLACQSDDTEQSITGQLGLLKANLMSPDAKAATQLLKTMLAQEGGESRMNDILKKIARDSEHDTLASNLFKNTREDPVLLEKMVRAMYSATQKSNPLDERNTEPFDLDAQYAEEEARGVLLYDLGLAAYKYGISLDGKDHVGEALRLWAESRDQLANVGGRNAYVARTNASSALANHYFSSQGQGKDEENLEALTKLVNDDSNTYDDSLAGLLAVLHASRGENQKAKAVLKSRASQALQILSDEMPENDRYGFYILQQVMKSYRDFKGAFIALSLRGHPDIVTDGMKFAAGDVTEDGVVDKEKVLEILTALAKETVQLARTNVPDSASQLKRIQVAKEHVDSLVLASQANSTPEANPSDEDKAAISNGSESATSVAHRLLQSRISELSNLHTPSINFSSSYACDGRTPDGKRCENEGDFDHDFYHCVYCWDRDFCPDCLPRLRDPTSDLITVCSANHQWMQSPRQGDEFYAGPSAKSVRVPVSVEPVNGDANILRACYAEHGGEEVLVEDWKASLAREWEIPLDEIKGSVAGLDTPERYA